MLGEGLELPELVQEQLARADGMGGCTLTIHDQAEGYWVLKYPLIDGRFGLIPLNYPVDKAGVRVSKEISAFLDLVERVREATSRDQ